MGIPDRLDIGTLYQTSLYALYHRFDAAEKNLSNEFLSDKGPKVCGFVLPPFQRDFVWSDEQMVRFVESAFLGLPLGTYTYNSTYEIFENMRTDENGQTYFQGNQWLLDGQQRLTTLERYFRSEFQVYGLYWKDLDRKEQLRFLMNTTFASYEAKFANEADCRRLYDLMAFGGTPHQEHERAMKMA